MRIQIVCLAMGCLTFTGCGTFSDRLCGPRVWPGEKEPVYYRGVRFDLLAAEDGGWKILMLLDIPFSAIWDTLRVPSLMLKERKRKTDVKGERPQFDPAPADKRE